MWREWFTFSQQDRRGILLLAILIVIALLLLGTKSMWRRENFYEAHTSDTLLQLFKDIPVQSEKIKVVPHPFDPNTADSLELLSVGLSPRVVRNILRYRKAGGIFRQPEDLARIYGMHDTVFACVKSYVTLSVVQKRTVETLYVPSSSDTVCREHPYAEYMRAKYKPGKFVELNTADTAELVKIPGIGPVRAQRIVEYRNALGGYHSIRQVHEACDLPEHLGDWVHISTPTIRKLQINDVSLSQLRAHPYLNFYQARAIIGLRKREGAICSVRQLIFLDEFTEEDLTRLAPYLSFQ